MILQVVTTTDRRGAEVFGVDLGAALERRGLEVQTVALVPGTTENQLSIETVGDRRLGPQTLLGLRRCISAADVVVGHGSSTLPACALSGVFVGTPFVYRNIGDPRYWGQKASVRVRTGSLLRRAQVVVALTAEIADHLVERYRVPRQRIEVIPKAVPAERFPPRTPSGRLTARGRLGLQPHQHVLACVGALSPEKSVHLAVRAVAELDDVHLVVAGDGPLRAELENHAASVAPGRVHFIGATEEPSEVLTAANALILTSATEGLPGVLIEAGLTGIPSVATDVGGVAEIVRDGKTGRVVRPGSIEEIVGGIHDVLTHEDEMGAAAREWCMDRFEIERIADEWLTLLEHLPARATT